MPRFVAVFSLLAIPFLTACDSGDSARAPRSATASRTPFATLAPDASYPVPFSYLSGVRELPDGRVFVADPLSQVLLRVDLGAGVADTLGRQGAGPREYDGPDQVLSLPGDSALLVDLGNARLTVVSPEGEFVAWIPMFRPREGASPRTLLPRFSDQFGNLYLTAASDPGAGPPDSTGISRFDREANTETVVAWAWHPERGPIRRGEPRPILVPMDDWAAAPDGSIAVVRANEFSVDWYRPDGEIVRGRPTAVETYPTGEPEKEEEMAVIGRDAMFMAVTATEAGEESRQMRRGIPLGQGPRIDDFQWPETLPVFRPNGTLVSPSGEAWVNRVMPRSMPPRYELFDGSGVHLGFVELPAGGTVIGFGTHPETRDRVYLARVDDLGLIWLERCRLVRP